MDRQGKLEYQQKVEKYLSDNHVYDLFEDLLKALIVKQPDNPIAYMIEKLGEPQSIPNHYVSQKDIYCWSTGIQGSLAGTRSG